MFTCSNLKEMFPRNKGNHDMEKRSLSLPDEKSFDWEAKEICHPRMRGLLNKHEGKKGIFADKFKFCKSVSLRP